MFVIDTLEFEQLVNNAVDRLPKIHRDKIQNVGFFVRENPSPQQLMSAGVRPGQLLLGLYSGVPLPQRNGNQRMMPDTITIFQRPIEFICHDLASLKKQIRQTVWHEVAHYFGLNHDRIYQIQNRTGQDAHQE